MNQSKNLLKNIWLICGGAILVGVILCMIGFCCGGAKPVSVGQNGIVIRSNTKHTTQDLNLNAFQSLDMNIQNADIEFVASDKYGIEICYYGDENLIRYSIENNTLKVTDGSKDQIHLIDLNFLYQNNVIKIYMPQKAVLENVKIANSCGNLHINGFSAQKTDISCSSGDVTMWDVSSKSLKIMNNCGGIDMRSITSDTMWVKTSAGNITMKDLTSSNTDTFNDCGNVTVNSSKLGNATFENHAGNIDALRITTTQLDAKNKCGNMKFDGELGGKSTLDDKSGNIDFATSLSDKDYEYNLSTNCGNIKVNGTDHAAHIKESSNAANNLVITNSCGNVNANFQK